MRLLLYKSMDWFLYDIDLRHERLEKHIYETFQGVIKIIWAYILSNE